MYRTIVYLFAAQSHPKRRSRAENEVVRCKQLCERDRSLHRDFVMDIIRPGTGSQRVEPAAGRQQRLRFPLLLLVHGLVRHCVSLHWEGSAFVGNHGERERSSSSTIAFALGDTRPAVCDAMMKQMLSEFCVIVMCRFLSIILLWSGFVVVVPV